MNVKSASIDFAKALNAEQYAAVTAPRGPALVLAGAGSGKTRTLTYRVAWLRAQGFRAWEILLLTFTNKAAREMVERVKDLTGEEKAVDWGGTFHSIGARFLRTNGQSVGLAPSYTIMDQEDAEKLFKEVAEGMNKAFFRDKEHPKPKLLQEWLSFSRNTCRDIEDVVKERRGENWADVATALTGFAEAYRQRKLQAQVVDYDDLQSLWLEALQKDSAALNKAQQRFKHILVDEYQDTNAIQSRIIDLLAHEHQIMAVGDDAQCIYTWRGAEFDNILHFPDRHPGTKIFHILSNYRSTQPILDFANDVLSAQAQAGSGYDKKLKAVRRGSLRPKVVPCSDGVGQARFVINRIVGLLDEGHSLDDIAILYRAHYQALDLQLELTRNGVPFSITSGIRFFEQAHIRDMVAQLRIIANPDDEPAFARVCQLLPKIGPKTATRLGERIGEVFLEQVRKAQQANDSTQRRGQILDLFAAPEPRVAEPCTPPIHPIAVYKDPKVLERVPDAGREAWLDFAETMAEAMEAYFHNPDKPGRAVQVLAEGWYGTYLRSAYDKADNRREDLDAFILFAQKYSDISELLAELVLLSSEAGEKGLEDPRGKLRLSTIHQAKGLEFPVVFLINAADGALPLQRALDEGDVDEERRLFYVAVTRAEDELYICHPLMQMQRGGGIFRMHRSRFIEEIGENRFESAKPRFTIR